MDRLKRLPREVQVVLGGGALYLIFSFFDWQQVSVLTITAGRSEWVGVGVIAGLLAVALLLWEAARAFEVKLQLGSLTPGLVSIALALSLLLFTLITFLSHNEARHWPAYVGLLLSIAIAIAAVGRARAEGVQLPELKPEARTDSTRAAAPAPPAPSPGYPITPDPTSTGTSTGPTEDE
jgi:hypothetical protein